VQVVPKGPERLCEPEYRVPIKQPVAGQGPNLPALVQEP
jgi:hypothetical protein